MTPERSNAYHRVMNTLNTLGPSKLQPKEQAQIRETADELLFCYNFEENSLAQESLTTTEKMLEGLVTSDRWIEETAALLAEDIRSCGPVREPIMR
jgi:hypothetical protein